MIAAVLGGAQARPEEVLTITREFDAPRHLVFAAWTQTEHQFRWMGPKDFTVLDCQIDLRVGGRYRTGIRSPEGQEYWFRGEYREVQAPERLVFTFAWEEEGERGMENLVSLRFSEQDGRTRMHFTQSPFQSESERDSHSGGWTECFERLGDFLAGRR